LKSEKLIFLTDVNGLYAQAGDPGTLISVLSEDQAKKQVEISNISGGMLPKVKACIEALEAGVHRAHILNGTIDHALLLEIFTDEGVGTMIARNIGS
jgi:acetylglutamate kinase